MATQIFAGAARSGRTSTGGLFRRPAGEGQWETVTKGLPERTDVRRGRLLPLPRREDLRRDAR